MVSQRDKEHFARLARAEERHRLASIERAAARTPSQNVEAAFAWSEFAASVGQRAVKAKVAPIQVWRARRLKPR